MTQHVAAMMHHERRGTRPVQARTPAGMRSPLTPLPSRPLERLIVGRVFLGGVNRVRVGREELLAAVGALDELPAGGGNQLAARGAVIRLDRRVHTLLLPRRPRGSAIRQLRMRTFRNRTHPACPSAPYV